MNSKFRAVRPDGRSVMVSIPGDPVYSVGPDSGRVIAEPEWKLDLILPDGFRKAQPKEVYGTSLIGVINISYFDLVSVFGQPDLSGSVDGKVKAEWAFVVNGSPITIYDWKESVSPRANFHWHIGGKNSKALLVVLDVLCSVYGSAKVLTVPSY